MFKPRRVLFEKDAFLYPLGNDLYKYFSKENVEVVKLTSNRVTGVPGDKMSEKYREGKQTLVIGVRKSLKFQTCKPSAHYQLPLVTGCMGQCEYCYLNTQLGDKPYIRAYVNIEEILDEAKKYMDKRPNEITIFEGAATSDPLPVEPYTKGLQKAISFFAKEPNGRFRFVTKYTNVDDFLGVDHGGHTTVRFSINTDRIIKAYEHKTPSAKERIRAAGKVIKSGYPLGFIIAPVFLYDGWQNEYRELLDILRQEIPPNTDVPIGFEIISHRYTLRAKNRILDVFPETTLPMEEEERSFKYGQFGYGKYVYKKEDLQMMREFFEENLKALFLEGDINYII